MVNINFNDKELQKFLKRVAYCAKFGRKNQREMLKINRRVSKTYWVTARRNIRDAKETIKIYRGDTVRMEVTPGTLRRSMGAWRSNLRTNVILAGVRFGKNAKSQAADGWYGGIVESGYAGSTKTHSTQNKGVLERTLRSTTETMRVQQVNEYRKEFKQYTR